jgi:restriction endonuclease S subunit
MKQRPAPQPAVEEQERDDLPEGWAVVRLGDGLVVDVQPGFACGVNNREGHGIAHIRPMNVDQDGQIDLSDLKYVSRSEADRDERLVCQDDVIFNNTNSPELVGKTACYGFEEPRAFSNHMTRVRCQREVLNPGFCAATLHQKWREGYFLSVCNNHVSQASVGRSVLLETQILLPPAREQCRIVSKVDELFRQVTSAHDRLARVPKILQAFRQAVLAAACSGRLTEDWREKNVYVTPASDLLKHIDQQRQRAASEVEGESELPKTWAWAALDRVAEVIDPNPSHRYPSYENGSIPILATENFEGLNDWNLSTAKLANAAFHAEREAAHGFGEDDIIFERKGRLGFARRPPKDTRYVFSHTLFIIRARDPMPSEYLLWFLRQDSCVSWLLHEMNPNTGVPTLGKGYMERVPVAIPPFREQQEIIRRVEALFKLAHKIEERVDAATKRADKLTQSILAKAFRGELVPTEAELARQEGRDYEPASAILKRIKAEREKSAASNNGTRRRKAVATKK